MSHALKPVWDEMHQKGYDAFSGTMLFRSIFQNYKHLLIHKRVLDIGCGTGDAFEWMKDVVLSYTGIDISEEACYKIDERFNKVWNYNKSIPCGGDGFLPIYPEDKIDTVFSALVFQHIQKTYLEKYFQEVSRILPRGGLFLFHTTQWPHKHQGHTNYDDASEKDFCLSGQYSYDLDNICPMLDAAGFQLISSFKSQNEPGLVKEKAWWWVFHAEKR